MEFPTFEDIEAFLKILEKGNPEQLKMEYIALNNLQKNAKNKPYSEDVITYAELIKDKESHEITDEVGNYAKRLKIDETSIYAKLLEIKKTQNILKIKKIQQDMVGWKLYELSSNKKIKISTDNALIKVSKPSIEFETLKQNLLVEFPRYVPVPPSHIFSKL